MKNLKLLFSAFVLFGSMISCAPNDEEIAPKTEIMDAFHTKGTEGGGDKPIKPRPE